VNDFDETAPGPWEWDVKRLAASLEIAARQNGFVTKDRTRIVRRSVRAYREAMAEFAAGSTLAVWYAHLDVDALAPRYRALVNPTRTPGVWKAIDKARAHDSLAAFEKLTHVVDGQVTIISNPPLVVPIDELAPGVEREVIEATLATIIQSYRDTLPPDRRHLLDHYRFAQLARKVVGVGSVGTDAWIALLIDEAHGEPVFLQIKQAEASVLERFTPTERVHQPRPTGRGRATGHADRQRHLPGVGTVRIGRRPSGLLLPATARLEGIGRPGRHEPRRHGDVGPHVWVDPGPSPCPIG
jgi:uncharacterized protein (DUF2252 family)